MAGPSVNPFAMAYSESIKLQFSEDVRHWFLRVCLSLTVDYQHVHDSWAHRPMGFMEPIAYGGQIIQQWMAIGQMTHHLGDHLRKFPGLSCSTAGCSYPGPMRAGPGKLSAGCALVRSASIRLAFSRDCARVTDSVLTQAPRSVSLKPIKEINPACVQGRVPAVW